MEKNEYKIDYGLAVIFSLINSAVSFTLLSAILQPTSYKLIILLFAILLINFKAEINEQKIVNKNKKEVDDLKSEIEELTKLTKILFK